MSQLIQWLLHLFGKGAQPAPAPSGEAPAEQPPQPAPPAPATDITLDQYLMGRDKIAPLTREMEQDAALTVERVNRLLARFGSKRSVTSGYRPKAVNDGTSNAAEHSKHLICQACDLDDRDGKLWAWYRNNLAVAKEIGLWMEDPRWTPTWVHVQIVPPVSGHRVFVPSTAPALAPKRWDGVYDHTLDGTAQPR